MSLGGKMSTTNEAAAAIKANGEEQEQWIEINDGTNQGVYYYCPATKERLPFIPQNFVHALWHDGTRRYVYRGICSRCLAPMPPPVLLASEHNQQCCSFILCDACLRMACGLSYSSKQRLVGAVMIPKCADQPACLKIDLRQRALRPNRAQEMAEYAQQAQLAVHRMARQRRDRRQTVALRAKARYQYDIVDGLYISWGDDPVKFDEYYGGVRDGVPHGLGIKVWHDGTTYVGTWEHGLMHSVDSPATYIRPDGSRYTGTFLNGVRHGDGTITYADGSEYSGNFASGFPHGNGTLIYANGDVFAGRFRFGRRDGVGVLTRADGTKEKRIFRDETSRYDPPPLDVTETKLEGAVHQPASLLDIALQSLGRAAYRHPSLFAPTSFRRRLPNDLKEPLARAYLEHRPGVTQLCKEHAPPIAWKDNGDVAFEGGRMSDEDVLAIINFCTGNPALKSIAFKSVKLRGPSIVQLSTYFSACPTLRKLDLSWNHLPLESCLLLMRALNGIPLEELQLAGCVLGPQGIRPVTEAFARSSSLKRLNLGFNAVRAVGATHIANLMVTNTSLEHLNIRCNELGIDGGALIAAALRENATLKQLVISDNRIGTDNAVVIAGRLRGGVVDLGVSFSVQDLH